MFPIQAIRNRYAGWAIVGTLAIASLWILSTEERTWHLALSTMKLALAAGAISLPLGTFLAVLFTRSDLPGRNWWFIACSSLLFVPLYLQCAGWRAGFGQQGWLTLAGNGFVTFPLVEGWRGAVWVHAMSAIPWVVIIVGASLQFVEPELEEDSLLDASTWQVLLRVTLWRALPGLYAASLWIVVTTAGEITATDLFMVRTLAEDLYLGYYLGESAVEAELGVLPALALFFLTAIAAWRLCEWLVPAVWEPPGHDPKVVRLGPWRGFATGITILLMLLIVGVPIASLAYKAGIEVTQTDATRVRHWSILRFFQTVGLATDWFNVRRWEFASDFAWSGAISGLAATCSLVIATGLAWWARIRTQAQWILVCSIAVCLALPGPLIGQGIIGMRNLSGHPAFLWLFDQTIFAPCLALALRGLPWCALVMWYAFRSLPDTALDAGTAEGVGSWTFLTWIALPQRRAALAGSWLIAVSIGMGDVGAVMSTVPPGVDVLAIRVFGLLHYGVEDKVAGICLVSIALFVAGAYCAVWAITRISKRPFA